jgi:hypothetical protein
VYISVAGEIHEKGIAILFFAMLLATSASAQQNTAASASTASISFKNLLSKVQLSTLEDSKALASSSQDRADPKGTAGSKQATIQLVIPEIEYVFKDSAFYMVVNENILVPVIGGGASGCFNRDLNEREEKIKALIQRLPKRVSF